MGVGAFERDLVDTARRQGREDPLVLPPFGAEARLPIDIRLDAVAVADVDGSLAGEALGGAVQRVDAPGDDVVQIDVEGWLVELDYIDPERRQLAGLLVQQLGESQRQRDPVAVMLVGDRIDDRHRPGQGVFEPPLRMDAGDQRFRRMHAAPPPERAGDGRHRRLVAVVADAHPHPLLEIDALDAFEKAVHEMLPRLLAVADDPSVFLELQREQGRVALALGQRVAIEPPRRPQASRLGQPGRLWQAAGNRGFEHADDLFSTGFALPDYTGRKPCGIHAAGHPLHNSSALSRVSRSPAAAGARFCATAANSWFARRRSTISANRLSCNFCINRVGVKPQLCAMLLRPCASAGVKPNSMSWAVTGPAFDW